MIYAPLRQIIPEILTVYHLYDLCYAWQDTALRWTEAHGVLIPTGKERAAQELQQAEQA